MNDDPMLTQDEMTRLQADDHDLITTAGFRSAEAYVLHLIHTAAYTHAAQLARGKSVLDLGCNTGYGTDVLSRSAAMVTGVDVSEKAIRVASETYGGTGIAFRVIDGRRLPFDEDTFEVVVGFQVLEHIVNHDGFLSEIGRVLAPGGIAVLTTPNAALRLDPGMKPWNEFHVREFSHGELASLLKPHFARVAVLGLRAEEPLYSIEVGRLERGRKRARAFSGTGRLSMTGLRERLKKKLPRGAAQIARRISDIAGRRHDAEVEELMNERGLKDLFYRNDELESALDLMALCSDDEATLEICMHRLVKRMV